VGAAGKGWAVTGGGRWLAGGWWRADGVLDGDERAELVLLRRENAQLKMDREFLKKAAAFFASDKNR
jgi:transposase